MKYGTSMPHCYKRLGQGLVGFLGNCKVRGGAGRFAISLLITTGQFETLADYIAHSTWRLYA